MDATWAANRNGGDTLPSLSEAPVLRALLIPHPAVRSRRAPGSSAGLREFRGVPEFRGHNAYLKATTVFVQFVYYSAKRRFAAKHE